jgi:hypothetical protein
MNTQSFFRLSGLAALVGAVVSFVAQLGSAFFYGETTSYANKPIYLVVYLVGTVSTILLLIGLPGVFASRAQGFGTLGLVGFALIFTTGCILGLFLNLLSVIVTPYLATKAPSLANDTNGPPAFFALFIIGSVFLAVGCVLVAIPLLRRRVTPRWPAFVLLLTAVYGVVSFFVLNGPSNSLVSSLLGAVTPMLLFVALAALGYQTWSRPSSGSEG